MPSTIQPVRPDELALRADEVRRQNAEREAQHPGLVLALSVRCNVHDAAPHTLCHSPSESGVSGVCGQRLERAVNLARSRRSQQRGQQRGQEARR